MIRILLLMAIGLLSCPLSAMAQTNGTVTWKVLDKWQVRIDPSLDNSCFIIAFFDQGTIFRLGFDKTDDSAYVIVSHPDWRSIDVGKQYQLMVEFDGAHAWTANVKGVSMNGAKALVATTKNKNFIFDIARRNSIGFRYQNRNISTLSLAGSYTALTEMLQCQVAVENHLANQRRVRDPFYQPRGGNDPFR